MSYLSVQVHNAVSQSSNETCVRIKGPRLFSCEMAAAACGGEGEERFSYAADKTKLRSSFVTSSLSKPVYFKRLTLSNVRAFGDRQHLDMCDGDGQPARWTLILGENGVGKTTI